MGKYVYIYGVLMCLAAHKYTIKSGGYPKDIAAPHQGVVLRVPREQERKKRTGQSPAFYGLGTPQGTTAL